MELTPFKCWDGKKHKWEAQHGVPSGWQTWCEKCGSTALLRRKYLIAGKWEFIKNSEKKPIFNVPEFFKHQEAN